MIKCLSLRINGTGRSGLLIQQDLSLLNSGDVEDSIKFKGKTLIIVQGEEDLASIPCIVYAPEGAIVIYGVPDKGIAVYEVGECLRKVVLGEIEKLIGD